MKRRYVVRIDMVIEADDGAEAELKVGAMLRQYPYDTYKYESYEITSTEELEAGGSELMDPDV